jgi:hypothetical protein
LEAGNGEDNEDLSHRKVEEIEKGKQYQARRPVKQGVLGLTTGDPDEHCLDVRTEKVGHELVDIYSSHVQQERGLAFWILGSWTGTDHYLESEVLDSSCNPAINFVLMSLGCYSNCSHLRFKGISASCSLGEIKDTRRSM